MESARLAGKLVELEKYEAIAKDTVAKFRAEMKLRRHALPDLPLRHRPGRLRIPEHGNARHARERGLEIFEPLAGEDGGHVGHACHIAPGFARLATRPAFTGSVTPINTTGNVPAAFSIAIAALVVTPTSTSGFIATSSAARTGKAVERAILVAVINDHVASLNVAELSQSLPKGLQPWCVR